MTKLETLQKYFGHRAFRGGQEHLIDRILSGGDVLGVMPTGAGKSVCFQVPALMMSGTAVVISPLISLMQDQVSALVQNGIEAACINSTISTQEYFAVCQMAEQGRLKLLYVAPERLETEGFAALCGRMNIPLVAVDEAHCVSHWGQDFRPSYLKIRSFVEQLPQRPVLAAFTATATDAVKTDIVQLLGLREPLSLTTGFDRPNLYFEVREPSDKNAELLDILRGNSGGAIVYCSTRKNVEKVTELLERNGISAGSYHAGMSKEERAAVQDSFIYDRLDVIAATNAFGMGIDKSNVSLVVHYNMPKDIESYYQEAGRAGRDGSAARCILLYGYEDVKLAEFMINMGHDEESIPQKERDELIKRDMIRLRRMESYVKTRGCLRSYILGYFGEHTDVDAAATEQPTGRRLPKAACVNTDVDAAATEQPTGRRLPKAACVNTDVDAAATEQPTGRRLSKAACGNCGNCTAGFDTVDITVEAQKILSCIFRLKQRNFPLGKTRVAKILLGAADKKMEEWGLTSLSTYGIMDGEDGERLREIMDILEAEGYFEVSGEHRVCVLTPKADVFIKEKQRVTAQLSRLPRKTAAKAASVPRVKPAIQADAQHQNPELFERLRALRKEQAALLGVPPYVVFSDTSLWSMCVLLPKSREEFLGVSGVGARKAERYGSLFLAEIDKYLKTRTQKQF